MDALTALHTRVSTNLLCEPAPTTEQLENIFKAGLRACDHRNLTPWKFIVIEGDARHRFGDLMVEVKTKVDGKPIDAALAGKIKAKPLRAPTIVAVVANTTQHEKVPESEQLYSAAASAQMMMVAAHAQGLGAIWRSGSLMFRPEMRAGLNLNEQDQIVAFIYLGTPSVKMPVPKLNSANFVEYW